MIWLSGLVVVLLLVIAVLLFTVYAMAKMCCCAAIEIDAIEKQIITEPWYKVDRYALVERLIVIKLKLKEQK